jgi:hypothetical protein
MTPKEKAKELIESFYAPDSISVDQDLYRAKHNALLCVDEVIFAFNFPKYNGDPETEINGDEIYWLDVKHELSLLYIT